MVSIDELSNCQLRPYFPTHLLERLVIMKYDVRGHCSYIDEMNMGLGTEFHGKDKSNKL